MFGQLARGKYYCSRNETGASSNVDFQNDTRQNVEFQNDTRQNVDFQNDTRQNVDFQNDTRQNVDFQNDTRQKISALTLSFFLPPPDSPPQGLGDIQVGYISK
jgi:hypothetical protein